MTKRYIIYCDESTKDGRYYSNFYGGALIEEKHREFIEKKLQEVKNKQNLFQELKWTKITENYKEKYKAFMSVYFDLVREKYIKTRILFSNNSIEPNIIQKPYQSKAEREADRYFKLYYQFLKHSFGLQYHPNDEKIIISLLLDRIPHRKEAFDNFKNKVNSLEYNQDFQNLVISIPKKNIVDVDSKRHVILQALDINLGAIHFRLNDFHKIKPKNQRRRGKRTRAKEEVYKFINKKIRQNYPYFNIGISTGKEGNIENRWNHPYRHWELIPSSATNTTKIAKDKR